MRLESQQCIFSHSSPFSPTVQHLAWKRNTKKISFVTDRRKAVFLSLFSFFLSFCLSSYSKIENENCEKKWKNTFSWIWWITLVRVNTFWFGVVGPICRGFSPAHDMQKCFTQTLPRTPISWKMDKKYINKSLICSICAILLNLRFFIAFSYQQWHLRRKKSLELLWFFPCSKIWVCMGITGKSRVGSSTFLWDVRGCVPTKETNDCENYHKATQTKDGDQRRCKISFEAENICQTLTRAEPILL